MIRFLFLVILLVSIYLYIKYHEQHPYFKVELISKKYNLANLQFIYLNKSDYIEGSNMILLLEDAKELMDVLEDCYIDNIKLEIKRK